MMIHQWRRDGYVVSTDPREIDSAYVHAFLTQSYWAEGIPLEVVQRSLEHSLAFGLYTGTQQIGLARVVTDYATFAYVADVFVDERFRGQGLGTWLVECVTAHPELQHLRRWMLFTRDAHEIYRKFGFNELPRPERAMEKSDPDVYKRTPHE